MTREWTSNLGKIVRIIKVINFVHILGISQVVSRRVPIDGGTCDLRQVFTQVHEEGAYHSSIVQRGVRLSSYIKINEDLLH
jgi:hypothetical protein